MLTTSRTMTAEPAAPAGENPSGVVVIDKPSGMTSHQVVARLRRILRTRKIGHAGTLDPMATGVLVCGVGRATRLLGHLMLGTKTYRATIRLGSSTVTDDAEGEVITAPGAAGITAADVLALLPEFTGDILQVPTQVSAIKIDGVRSYARVRAGEHADLKARPVTVHRFELLGADANNEHQRSQEAVAEADPGPPECDSRVGPTPPQLDVDVEVECSSGTYIRALARDLGERLGCGGHLTALRRTQVGPYGLDRADELTDATETVRVIDISTVARENFPAVALDPDRSRDVRYGRRITLDPAPAAGPVAVFDGEEFLALYDRDGRPQAVFV